MILKCHAKNDRKLRSSFRSLLQFIANYGRAVFCFELQFAVILVLFVPECIAISRNPFKP